MPELLVDAAPWIALCAGSLALVIVGWNAYLAWHLWRRARVTQQAATALLDVHAQRIDSSLQVMDQHAGAFADDGERLSAALTELRADVGQLRWMLGRIPQERARFMREVSDLLLPTDSDDDADAREPVGAGTRDA